MMIWCTILPKISKFLEFIIQQYKSQVTRKNSTKSISGANNITYDKVIKHAFASGNCIHLDRCGLSMTMKTVRKTHMKVWRTTIGVLFITL